MTSAYANYDTSYVQRTPYLTAQEYIDAPTAMDVSNLLPQTSGPDGQNTALLETIARASSWIDQHCMGAWGSLTATSNTENGRIWGTNYGTLPVHPKYWPILEVESFAYTPVSAGGGGYVPSSIATSASIDPSTNIWIEPQQFIVQPNGMIALGWNAGAGIASGVQYYCTWTYVSGWPVSTLSASVAAGAASITPVSTMGLYPGTTLTMYDSPNDEQIQVASNYVPHTTPVPLTSPVVYNHNAGVMVTNLPPAIKQAAILLTTALIKQRGSGALIVQDMGATTKQDTGLPQEEDADISLAAELLAPFRQIFVGY